MVTWFNASWYQSQRCGLLSMVWILTCSWWNSLLTSDIRSHQTEPKMTTDFDCYPLQTIGCHYAILYRTNPCHDTLFWKPWELRILCHHGFHHRSLRKTTLPEIDAEHLRKKTINGIYLAKDFVVTPSPKQKKKGNKNTKKDSQRFSCFFAAGDRRPKIDMKKTSASARLVYSKAMAST